MTQEEKAKAYDEALGIAKTLYGSPFVNNDVLEQIFPELKELEDERIRDCIGMCLTDANEQRFKNYSTSLKECLTWLEKQGEHKKFRDLIQIGDKVTRNEAGELVNLSQLERIAKQPRSKTTLEAVNEEKAAPKFKVGDWVVWDNKISCHIDNIYQNKESLMYTITDIHSMTRNYSVKGFDNNAHLWTMQEARDGDILVHSNCMFEDFIFIYNNTSNLQAYCYYSTKKDKFIIEDGGHYCPWNMQVVTPATREQCILLFQKMEKACYEWNSEKKVLIHLDDTL